MGIAKGLRQRLGVWTIAVGLLSTLIFFSNGALLAGEIYFVEIKVQDGDRPVVGAVVTIENFDSITGKDGVAYFDLYEAEYDVSVSRSQSEPPRSFQITVTNEQTSITIDLRDTGQTQTLDPNRAYRLAVASFTDAESLSAFWDTEAPRIVEQLGEPRLAFDESGRFLVQVVAGPTSGEPVDEVLNRAVDIGYGSSFAVPEDSLLVELETLGTFDLGPVEADLIDLLSSDDVSIRRATRLALGNLGQPGVPALLSELSGDNYRIDLGVAVALSQINGWSAQPEELTGFTKVLSAYNDETLQFRIREALSASDANTKLSTLGFSTDRTGTIQFQQEANLKPDGVVGPRTRSALNDRFIAHFVTQTGKNWAGLRMGVYGLGMDDKVFNQIVQSIDDKGAEILRGYVLNQRTSWLALESTVFFYRTSSADRAKEIAAYLSEQTGQKFEARRGKGLGVARGFEEVTFFVHIIVDVEKLLLEMNNKDRSVRRAAVAEMIENYRTDRLAVSKALDQLIEPNIETLSPEGLINVLFYLERTEPYFTWDNHQIDRAKSAIRDIRIKDTESQMTIGPQTEAALRCLEKSLFWNLVVLVPDSHRDDYSEFIEAVRESGYEVDDVPYKPGTFEGELLSYGLKEIPGISITNPKPAIVFGPKGRERAQEFLILSRKSGIEKLASIEFQRENLAPSFPPRKSKPAPDTEIVILLTAP